MKRRAFVTALGAVLAAPLGAGAQPTGKTAIVAVISPGSSEIGEANVATFKSSLHDLGYTDRTKVRVEVRYLDGNFERIPSVVTELVGLGTSVIVVGGTTPARAVARATKTVPVVFVAVSAPVEDGLIKTLANPGGNVTGLSTAHEEGLAEKWVQLVRDAFAKLSRAAVLHNPGNPSNVRFWRAIHAAASRMRVTLKSFEATTLTQLDAVHAEMSPRVVQAAIVTTDPFFFAQQARIIASMARQRIPAIYGFRNFADNGGLMSYGASLPETYRRAAVFVDKILKGSKPADLPVEQPTTFEFIINMKIAKTLGLTIPPSLLLRADQLIE